MMPARMRCVWGATLAKRVSLTLGPVGCSEPGGGGGEGGGVGGEAGFEVGAAEPVVVDCHRDWVRNGVLAVPWRWRKHVEQRLEDDAGRTF